ncbi:MAG TPA: DnaB-like helicase C-terminal domain-containing protein [Candidatus Binatia bacterium]
MPQPNKISNLIVAMAEKKPPVSEAEELDSFLAELQSGGEIKELAGCATGFASLDRVLNGISPGLYLLVGPPACGKSAFAKQILDQVARHNSVPALFFAFNERKADLRIRTLARLSGLESREVRRGAGYLLHAYGVPKYQINDPNEMAPGWDKLKLVAEGAKRWLDFIYVHECGERTTLNDIERRVREVREAKKSQRLMVIIDDSQRLGDVGFSLEARLLMVAEMLQGLAAQSEIAVLATWPELQRLVQPQEWAERVAGANVVMVMRESAERKPSFETDRAIDLHVVKNRSGEKATLRFNFSPSFSKFTEQTD